MMETRKPTIEHHGMFAEHDMPCPILHDSGESAVLNLGTAQFEPSWKAQSMGYRIVKADKWWKKLIVKAVFK